MKMKIIGIIFMAMSINAFSQSQLEINADAQKKLEDSEKKLEDIQRSVMADSDNDPGISQLLEDENKAWDAYVKKHVEFTYPLHEGENPNEVYGSIYVYDVATLKKELVDQRIKLFSKASEPQDKIYKVFDVSKIESKEKGIAGLEDQINQIHADGWKVITNIISDIYLFEKVEK
jgi:hypothetical protein